MHIEIIFRRKKYKWLFKYATRYSPLLQIKVRVTYNFFYLSEWQRSKGRAKERYYLTELCGGRCSHTLLGTTRENNMGISMKIKVNIPVDLTITLRTKNSSNRRHQ